MSAIQTVNAAFDPEVPSANHNNTMLDAVTKDQLNIGIRGQLRYKLSEDNLYAYLFGVSYPIAHVMGYFVSVLRERIATFQAKQESLEPAPVDGVADTPAIEGISINDLRKNLNEVNLEMDRECLSSAARYGVVLDASLITGMDPPEEIESALAAINTAHNRSVGGGESGACYCGPEDRAVETGGRDRDHARSSRGRAAPATFGATCRAEAA